MADRTSTPRTVGPVTSADVSALLRELPAVRDLPDGDPRRVAWLERKRDLLERIGRR